MLVKSMLHAVLGMLAIGCQPLVYESYEIYEMILSRRGGGGGRGTMVVTTAMPEWVVTVHLLHLSHSGAPLSCPTHPKGLL